MERRHKELLAQGFDLTDKYVQVLHIPDHYHYNDPELVKLLHIALVEFF